MDFIEQLKSSVDIVQVVGDRVRLRKSGPLRYLGLCPFHTEKTPSFTVHATHQFYKCFGCGAGGDVIKFVEQTEGVSFYEGRFHSPGFPGTPGANSRPGRFGPAPQLPREWDSPT